MGKKKKDFYLLNFSEKNLKSKKVCFNRKLNKKHSNK